MIDFAYILTLHMFDFCGFIKIEINYLKINDKI